MSYETQDKVWEMEFENDELNSAATLKLVILALAWRENSKTGLCNPSYSTIAKDTGLSRRGAINAIDGLAKSGAISVDSGGARRKRNRYTINADWSKSCTSESGRTGASLERTGASLSPALVQVLPQTGARVALEQGLNTEYNREEEQGRTESLDGDDTGWESLSSSPPRSQSLTGIPVANSGGNPKPPVQPASPSPVQPVQPVKPVQAPPAPAQPPKKIWETFDKIIDGIPAQDMRRALEFWGKDSKDSYYRENGKITDSYVSNPKNAHRLVDATPPDYQPKPVEPVANPACPKCRGTGQLKAKFVKVDGQRIEQTIIPPCPCLHIPGAEKQGGDLRQDAALGIGG